jgi:hypothetical protein
MNEEMIFIPVTPAERAILRWVRTSRFRDDHEGLMAFLEHGTVVAPAPEPAPEPEPEPAPTPPRVARMPAREAPTTWVPEFSEPDDEPEAPQPVAEVELVAAEPEPPALYASTDDAPATFEPVVTDEPRDEVEAALLAAQAAWTPEASTEPEFEVGQTYAEHLPDSGEEEAAPSVFAEPVADASPAVASMEPDLSGFESDSAFDTSHTIVPELADESSEVELELDDEPELPDLPPQDDLTAPPSSFPTFQPAMPSDGTFIFKLGDRVIEGEDARGFLVAAMETLLAARHLRAEHLPVATSSRKYLLAARPLHPSGRKFVDSVQLGDLWLEADRTPQDVQRSVVAILDALDLPYEIVRSPIE